MVSGSTYQSSLIIIVLTNMPYCYFGVYTFVTLNSALDILVSHLSYFI